MNPLNFTAGKFIDGQSSRARGIVEQLLTQTNELVLSRVTGEFVPGETLQSEQDGTFTPFNFSEEEGTIAEFKFSSFGSGYTNLADIIATINIDGVNRLTDIGTSNINLLNNKSGQSLFLLLPEKLLELSQPHLWLKL